MSERLDPLFADAIQALDRLFNEIDRQWTVIGGIAVGLLGVPRATKDVDALIIYDTADVDKLIDAAREFDLHPRYANTAEFARESRVLFLVHGADRALVDVALGCMPFEQDVIERATRVQEGNCRVPLPTPEDLIILKSIASRPQDLVDIQSVAEIQPSLDRKRIRHWLKQYGDLLEDPALWSRIEPLLNSH